MASSTKIGVCRAGCGRDDARFSSSEGYMRQTCNVCRRDGKKAVLPKWETENKERAYNHLPTYGEAFTFVLMSDWIATGNGSKSVPLPSHRPRMSRKDAVIYYSNKINKAMGWEDIPRYRHIPSDFDVRFPEVLKKALVDRDRMIKREVKKNYIILMQDVA